MFLVVVLLWIIPYSADACNQSYSGRIANGVIKSFNYPFDYINNLSCTYKFYFSDAKYTTSKKICFKTRRFDLERSIAYCTFDYLQIEDNKYCGRGLWQKGLYDPKQPTSSLWVNNLCWSLNNLETFELKFVSDSSVVGAGFYFEYSIINNATDFSHQYPGNCSSGQWMCFNRRCIDASLTCDAFDDCGDGSDETYLHARCPPGTNSKTENDDNNDNINNNNNNNANTDPPLVACEHQLCGASTCDVRIDGMNVMKDISSTFFQDNSTSLKTTSSLSYMNITRMRRATSDTLPTHSFCFSFWYLSTGPPFNASIEVYVRTSGDPRLEYTQYLSHRPNAADWTSVQLDLKDVSNNVEVVLKSFLQPADRGTALSSNVIFKYFSIAEGMCSRSVLSCVFVSDLCAWSSGLLDGGASYINDIISQQQRQIDATWVYFFDTSDVHHGFAHLALSQARTSRGLLISPLFYLYYNKNNDNNNNDDDENNKDDNIVQHLYMKYYIKTRNDSSGRCYFNVYLLKLHNSDVVLVMDGVESTVTDRWHTIHLRITQTVPYQIVIEGLGSKCNIFVEEIYHGDEENPRLESLLDRTVLTRTTTTILPTVASSTSPRIPPTTSSIISKSTSSFNNSNNNNTNNNKASCLPSVERMCDNMMGCFKLEEMCDGQNDCADGSDENNCRAVPSGRLGSLNDGGIAGIAIAGLLIVTALVIACCLICRRCKQHQKDGGKQKRQPSPTATILQQMFKLPRKTNADENCKKSHPSRSPPPSIADLQRSPIRRSQLLGLANPNLGNGFTSKQIASFDEFNNASNNSSLVNNQHNGPRSASVEDGAANMTNSSSMTGSEGTLEFPCLPHHPHQNIFQQQVLLNHVATSKQTPQSHQTARKSFLKLPAHLNHFFEGLPSDRTFDHHIYEEPTYVSYSTRGDNLLDNQNDVSSSSSFSYRTSPLSANNLTNTHNNHNIKTTDDLNSHYKNVKQINSVHGNNNRINFNNVNNNVPIEVISSISSGASVINQEQQLNPFNYYNNNNRNNEQQLLFLPHNLFTNEPDAQPHNDSVYRPYLYPVSQTVNKMQATNQRPINQPNKQRSISDHSPPQFTTNVDSCHDNMANDKFVTINPMHYVLSRNNTDTNNNNNNYKNSKTTKPGDPQTSKQSHDDDTTNFSSKYYNEVNQPNNVAFKMFNNHDLMLSDISSLHATSV